MLTERSTRQARSAEHRTDTEGMGLPNDAFSWNISLGINHSSFKSNFTEIKDNMDEKNWPALFILAIIFFTVAGNILVIMAVSLETKLHNATNYFLCSLAVADMLVGFLVMPVSLVSIFYNNRWPLPDLVCPMWIFLDVLFSTASIMHLCAISLDRYIGIRDPFKISQSNTLCKTLIKIVSVWTISVVLSLPIPVIGFQDLHKVLENGTCAMREPRYVLIGSFVAFFCPLVIMVFSYCLTLYHLQKHSTSFPHEGTNASNNSNTTTRLLNSKPSPKKTTILPNKRPQGAQNRGMNQAIKNEQRASKVLGIVFFLFLIMWCPFFITNVIIAICALCDGQCSKHLHDFIDVFVWVGYVSSGVNPLIYTLFNKIYRQAFVRYLQCKYN